jgi:hypothetical protein
MKTIIVSIDELYKARTKGAKDIKKRKFRIGQKVKFNWREEPTDKITRLAGKYDGKGSGRGWHFIVPEGKRAAYHVHAKNITVV